MKAIMGLFDWLSPRPALDAATQAQIEHAVASVDPGIRQVSGYATKLAPAIRHALDYCTEIAARIPGPFEISRAAFATDPMVHALFASADAIETMLARSQCVRDHMLELTATNGRCCALLGMRHREKAGFGVELAGDVVRADVPQKILYFSDHTLAEPGPDVETCRQRLRQLLFDSLLKGFAAHVANVRAERQGLHEERAIEYACVRGGSDPETHTRRLAALEAQLRKSADALQPARLLDTLAAALAAPEPFLRVDPFSVVVDHSGIITNTGSGETLNFVELTSRDQRRWVVVFVHIAREEARRALDRFEQAHRHIVI